MNLELLVRLIFQLLIPVTYVWAREEYKYKIQREDVQIEKVPLSVSILCLHVKECVYKNIYTLDIYDDLYYV